MTTAPAIIPVRWSVGRLLLTIALCVAGWAAVAALCIALGTTGAFGWPQDLYQYQYRRELVLMASLVGASLAAAGVVYQAILRNPLADPYLLGVSSGASLASYLWRLIPPIAAGSSSLAAIFTGLTPQAFAFAGAAISVASVFALSTRRGRLDPLTLLLVGVIVNSVNASIYLLISTIHRDLPGAGSGLNFLVGGLQTNLSSAQEISAATCAGIGFLVLMYLSGELNVATLSESEAAALGVGIHRLRWIALVVASLVTASAVAVSGPIGFVGLICPHLARLLVGQDTRKLLPTATALGAALLALADAFSRKLAASRGLETVLPVGVLTGLLGGPFFLMLLWQNRRRLE
jgi:iron complex transport system permease protein